MPSVGRIKQVSAVGIAAAVLGVTASSASAQDVWLWACHGPSGQALSNLGRGSAPAPAGACSENAGGNADGLSVHQTSTAPASRAFDVPSFTTLNAVRIARQTSLVAGQRYALRVQGGPDLESRTAAQAPFDGEATLPASGSSLLAEVACVSGAECAPPASGAGVNIGHLAFRVTDSAKPTGVIGGWRSPASNPQGEPMQLEVVAADNGVGLKDATGFLDGQQTGPPVSFVAAGEDNRTCEDLSPDSATVDLPYSAVGQNDAETGPVGCVSHGTVKVPVDTRKVNDGPGHEIKVVVTDWAGNATEIVAPPTEVLNNVNLGSPTQQLSIGTSGISQQPSTGGGGGSGGVAGATSSSCRSPRLSMFLAQKPMRVSRGVPVLQRGKRYRFNGRLTCVINGKRRSAPKRTRVDILNTIGRKTVEKAGTTTRDQGRLTVILAYKTSRTLIFRFTNADAQRSQVRIRVKVARKKR